MLPMTLIANWMNCRRSFLNRQRQRIAEMADFLNDQPYELEEYDEQLVRRLIEKITVYDDKLTVVFKSGVEIDI